MNEMERTGFQAEKDFAYLNGMLQEYCQHYQLPLMHLQSAQGSRDVLVLHYRRNLSRWEKLVIEKDGEVYTVGQMMKTLNDEIRQFFIPRLESYYRVPVRCLYLTDYIIKEDSAHRYITVVLEQPVFVGEGPACPEKPEELAALVAEQVKAATGRAPSLVEAVRLSRQVLVYFIAGAISETLLKYAASNIQGLPMIEEVVRRMAEDAVRVVHEKEGGVEPEKHIQLDIERNQIVILVLLDEGTEE